MALLPLGLLRLLSGICPWRETILRQQEKQGSGGQGPQLLVPFSPYTGAAASCSPGPNIQLGASRGPGVPDPNSGLPVRHAKLLPMALTSVGASLSPDCSTSHPHPASVGKQRRMAQVLGSLIPHGRPRGSFQLVALDGPSSSYCGNVGSDPADGSSFCVCLLSNSVTQIKTSES